MRVVAAAVLVVVVVIVVVVGLGVVMCLEEDIAVEPMCVVELAVVVLDCSSTYTERDPDLVSVSQYLA